MTTQINIPDATDRDAVTVLGDKIVFVRISQDCDAENPITDWEGNGRIISFGRRHTNFQPSEDALKEHKANPYAVELSYFEHSCCVWGVKGNMPPGTQCPWDCVPLAGLWLPDEEALKVINAVKKSKASRIKKAEEIAKQACELYTAWCNGDVYSYEIAAYKVMYDRNEIDHNAALEPLNIRSDYRGYDPILTSSCSWYYGVDAVKKGIKDAIEDIKEELGIKG